MKKRFIKGRKVKKNKFGSLLSLRTICVVLIASFGLLGASYAYWSQSFSILGSISTGNINVTIRDAVLESSDAFESGTFSAQKDGNILDTVELNVVTGAEPFNMIISFMVENNGTVPIRFVGLDQSIYDNLEIEVLESPEYVDVGEISQIKLQIEKGYCTDFNFSTFFKFEQTIN